MCCTMHSALFHRAGSPPCLTTLRNIVVWMQDARAALAALHDTPSFDAALALLVENPKHALDQPLHPTACTPADAVLCYAVTVPASFGGYFDVCVDAAGQSWTTQVKIPVFETLRAEMVEAFPSELGGLPAFPQPDLYSYMTAGPPLPELVEARRLNAADFLRAASHLPVVCEYEPLLRFLGVHEHVYQAHASGAATAAAAEAAAAEVDQSANPLRQPATNAYELQELGDPHLGQPRRLQTQPAAVAAPAEVRSSNSTTSTTSITSGAASGTVGGEAPPSLSPIVRLAIVGLGGLGSVLAGLLGRWAQRAGGVRLTCIGRGDHLAQIKTNGLWVQLPDRGGTAFAVQEGAAVRFIDVDNAVAAAGPQDLVLLCTPEAALPALGAAVGPLLADGAAVVTFHPGLPWWAATGDSAAADGAAAAPPLLWGKVGAEAAIHAVPTEFGGWDCWRRAAGEVVARVGDLTLGSGGAAAMDKAELLQTVLSSAGIGSVQLQQGGGGNDGGDKAGQHPLSAAWLMLATEHVWGCVAALSQQQTVSELAALPASLQLVHGAASELFAAAKVAGVPLTSSPAGGTVTDLLGAVVMRHSEARPRLLAALVRGGPSSLEAAAALHRPLQLARAGGLACPTLGLLAQLCEARAAAAAPMDVEEHVPELHSAQAAVSPVFVEEEEEALSEQSHPLPPQQRSLPPASPSPLPVAMPVGVVVVDGDTDEI